MHLVVDSLVIAFPSRVSSWIVLFGIAFSISFPLGGSFSIGVSGITVPDRYSAVPRGGVVSITGVAHGEIGDLITLIFYILSRNTE